MVNKIIKFGNIKEISEAFEELYKAVSITLGPGGKLVMINPLCGEPFVTKDGVTVSDNIGFDDTIKNTAIDIIKQISRKTCSNAGDGTTTSVVIAHELFKKYYELGLDKFPVRKFKYVLDKYISIIHEKLSELSIPITNDDILGITSTSSNGDELASNIITEVFNKVGLSGSVYIENSRDSNTNYIIKPGYQINKGFISPALSNSPETGECIQENAKVLIVDKTILDFNELVPVLNIINKNNNPLLIIALGYGPEVVNGLVINKCNGLNICAVMAPYIGQKRTDAIYDLSAISGAKVISTVDELKDIPLLLDSLGTIKKSIVSRDYTTIINDNCPDKLNRINTIKNLIETAGNSYDRDQLTERLSKLSDGIAIIKVGGSTPAEQKELSDRIEDAVCAVRSANESGIVVGGGYALKYIGYLLKTDESNQLCSLDQEDDEFHNLMLDLVISGCRAPFIKIQENAEVQVDCEDHEYGVGINSYTWKLCNLLKDGIIDPLKVTKSALDNAVSIFKLLISTGCVVADTKASGVGI